MKGYKGFKKGLICEGPGYRKQYEVGKTYEEDEAIPCEKGMHFCKNILDVLDHYPLIGDDGELNEFCEVDALDDPKTDDNKKWASKKLKIVKKLSPQEFINISVSQSGDWSKLAASGDWSKLAASGDWSKLAASGEGSVIANIGIGGKAKGSSGCWITLAEYDAEGKPICVKTERVDGNRIKADTWYQLVEGEFKEV